MPPDTTIRGNLWSRRFDDYVPSRRILPEPLRLDNSSPEDVKTRAKERIEELKRHIKVAKESLVKQEAELAEWEAIVK